MKGSTIRRSLCNGAGVLALAGALAACGGSNNGTVVIPPVQTAQQEDFFGTGFGALYRNPPNTVPVVSPSAGDIIALSLTTNPQPLH